MAKHKLSLRLYEELVVLLKQSGVDVGDTDNFRIIAREMNEVIAEHGRGQVKEFIETPSDIFGRRPNIGVAADKLSDLAQKQRQMVMIRLNFKGTPLALFAKNAILDLGYDPYHESNGYSCFNELCEVVESYGVNLLKKKRNICRWGRH
jgi:hypothetical protein